MPNKLKKSYFISFVAVVIGFVLLCLVFDTGLLGKKSAYFNGLVVIGMFYTIIVCSLNLLTGYMGEFSLGHAGFMSIGAYASAIVTTLIQYKIELPTIALYIIAILVGGIAAGIIGILVGIPALRLSGDYLCIVTVAVAEIVRVILSNFGIQAITGNATFGKSFAGIAKVSDYHYVYITMIICIVVMYCYIRSRYGRALIAIREDRIAAAASGINVTRTKVLTFTISAFFAGVAGAIYAHYITTLVPTYFNFSKSSEFLAIVILGGSGSLTGSIVAAPILSALPQLISYVVPAFASYRMLIYAIILVVVMIFKPTGLFGGREFSLPKLIDKIVKKEEGKGER
jgi:branched-chain amino acid transport system permease protein